ncbi:MaoC/PaaZ C-terminal domain-containing protein [Agrococcus casei]|uniref:MaoC-like domain-containing protein n=1 Tax=Agrococcus casei LMG 22410 TaxID=1255656 RepID=A0A1R4GGU0_9MICO|nr:MaoC/PaaZ C-terminal domain-containing protein [Agrococcus casei]SJM67457.1 hypothetical protein CZ674_11970 [Agrococcus casei LMG 22410]
MSFALSEGQVIAKYDAHFSRDSLVRYAGASGDFNAIHYRDDVAQQVGLPGVLAHGMLTMGTAIQPVVDFFGDPGRIVDYQVRFTRPVPVDTEAGADVHITATVAKDLGEGLWRIDLKVTLGEQTVLGKSQAIVRAA